ncbi:MAG: hypothetical protein INF11_04770 [Methylobacterium sp.]|nr:hypothetical protein [Cupriavidus sp.]MCA3671236.1 hypothetical protein [Methylobacterium sp.]MCA3678412.1 hypothetical protein [Methylobacterium sp.]
MKSKPDLAQKVKQNADFVAAAQALKCDESEQRFNEALGKIVRHKPKPDKPPEKAPETEDKKPAK